ncbi:MAG: hypothetical protein ACUVV6_00350 [Thermoplasmatota archaeon]
MTRVGTSGLFNLSEAGAPSLRHLSFDMGRSPAVDGGTISPAGARVSSPLAPLQQPTLKYHSLTAEGNL